MNEDDPRIRIHLNEILNKLAPKKEGIMRADIHVSMIYLGGDNKDELLEELSEKYGLNAKLFTDSSL